MQSRVLPMLALSVVLAAPAAWSAPPTAGALHATAAGRSQGLSGTGDRYPASANGMWTNPQPPAASSQDRKETQSAPVTIAPGQPRLASEPASANRSSRLVRTPVDQAPVTRVSGVSNPVAPSSRSAGLPPIKTGFEDLEPARIQGQQLATHTSQPVAQASQPATHLTESETPSAAWDAEALLMRQIEAPKLSKAKVTASSSSTAFAPATPHEGVRTAEVGQGDLPIPAAEQPWYSNTLRQNSPLPASNLASPATPARLVEPKERELVGEEAEYAERDSFSYSVLGETKREPVRTTRAVSQQPLDQQPRTRQQMSKQPTVQQPVEAIPTSGGQPVGVHNPVPQPAKLRSVRTGAAMHRSAPSRWFRPNPLREPVLAETETRTDGMILQTSANEVANYQDGDKPAAAAPAAEEPFPFDFDNAVKEAEQPKSALKPKTEPKPESTPPATPEESEKLPFDLPAATDEKPAQAPKQSAPATDAPSEKVPSTFPASPLETPSLETPTEPMPKLPADNPAVPSEEPSFGDRESALPETADVEVKNKSITSLTTNIEPPAGELPADHSGKMGANDTVAYPYGQASRGWAVSSYQWEAPALCHQPLYFEEVNLERYGYGFGAVQPAISYGQFIINVLAMPYKYVAEPSRECVYTLGHYRPGSCAPYRIHYPARSAAGGMFEAGVILGLVFVIP